MIIYTQYRVGLCLGRCLLSMLTEVIINSCDLILFINNKINILTFLITLNLWSVIIYYTAYII